jgi:hypothetical protein
MRRLIDDESGVSAVLIAFCLIMLLGFAGFAIDAGAMYQERRELRRGADAAALAIAEDVVTGSITCSDAAGVPVANAYGDANADDGMSAVDLVDIRGESVMLGCSEGPTGNPDHTVTVEVTLSAEDTAGLLFKTRFMRVLGISTVDVHGSATAAVGPPGSASGLPLVISDCEWNRLGAEWAVGETVTLWFHDGNSQEPCNPGGSGSDVPGGFGWLATDGSCLSILLSGGWADAGTGVSPPCTSSEIYDLLVGDDGTGNTILVPFFDMTRGSGGANIDFHIVGWGAFEVQAYDLKPGSLYRWPTGFNCPPPPDDGPSGGGPGGGGPPGGGGNPADDVCLVGAFETGEVITEGDLGGEYRGVYLVRLVK